MISIIIPVYNGEKYLTECLRSVFNSDYADSEVIVVNDGSTDNSLEIINSFPCRVINLENNLGVANARNVGANAARGDLLIFFDADIVIEKDTISNFKRLHEDSNILISSCQVYPKSLSRGFTPDILAIDWCYIYKQLEKQASYIPSMNFAIYKKVFSELGQFSGAFKSAGGEEIEIGMHAMRKGCKIYVDQSFYVRHHFQSFWPRCKTLFRRGYVYGRIVLQRNLICDKGHGTMREAMNAGLSLLGTLALILSIFIPYLLILFFATAVMQIFLDIGLNLFIVKRRGILFLIGSMPVHYIWYLVMGLSIFKALLVHFYQNLILGKEQPALVRKKY